MLESLPIVEKKRPEKTHRRDSRRGAEGLSTTAGGQAFPSARKKILPAPRWRPSLTLQALIKLFWPEYKVGRTLMDFDDQVR